MSKKLTYTIMTTMVGLTLIIFLLSYFLGWNPGIKATNVVTNRNMPTFFNMIYGPFDKAMKKPMDLVRIDGKIYVTDSGNHTIKVFDDNGDLKFEFGEGGTSEGKFMFPNSITSDSKKLIYISDLTNGNIQIFDKNGKFIKTFKTDSNKELPIKTPGAVRIVNDQLYVTDIKTGSFYIYSLQGKEILKVERQLVNGLEVNAPNGIFPDKEGNIYLSDSGNSRILKFSKSGKYISTINGSKGGKGNPTFITQRGIGISSDNVIYIADKLSHRILGYSTDGKQLFKYGSYGADIQNFILPNSVYVDTDGTLYVTDSGNARIMIFK